jgi:hypothetical protein
MGMFDKIFGDSTLSEKSEQGFIHEVFSQVQEVIQEDSRVDKILSSEEKDLDKFSGKLANNLRGFTNTESKTDKIALCTTLIANEFPSEYQKDIIFYKDYKKTKHSGSILNTIIILFTFEKLGLISTKGSDQPLIWVGAENSTWYNTHYVPSFPIQKGFLTTDISIVNRGLYMPVGIIGDDNYSEKVIHGVLYNETIDLKNNYGSSYLNTIGEARSLPKNLPISHQISLMILKNLTLGIKDLSGAEAQNIQEYVKQKDPIVFAT